MPGNLYSICGGHWYSYYHRDLCPDVEPFSQSRNLCANCYSSCCSSDIDGGELRSGFCDCQHWHCLHCYCNGHIDDWSNYSHWDCRLHKRWYWNVHSTWYEL